MYKYIAYLLIAAMLSISVPQQSRADVPEARSAALKFFKQNFSNRYFLHPRYYTSTLAEGEEAIIRIPVFKGNTYIFAAVGDSKVIDVDMYSYDEDGDRWAFDTTDRSFGAVSKRARWTGYILVRVHAARGAGSVCVVTGHR